MSLTDLRFLLLPAEAIELLPCEPVCRCRNFRGEDGGELGFCWAPSPCDGKPIREGVFGGGLAGYMFVSATWATIGLTGVMGVTGLFTDLCVCGHW
jgi:hypothetical protein